MLQFDYDTICGTCPFRAYLGAGPEAAGDRQWAGHDAGYGVPPGSSAASLLSDDLRVLGLAEGDRLDLQRVKEAFRCRAQVLHPDKVPPNDRPDAEEEFKRLLNSFRRMKSNIRGTLGAGEHRKTRWRGTSRKAKR